MRIIIILIFCILTSSYGQTLSTATNSKKPNELSFKENKSKLDTLIIDTLHLDLFSAKKLIAYKYLSVTFYIDYKDYLKELKYFLKNHKQEIRATRNRKIKGEFFNPESYSSALVTVDSIYHELKTISKRQDTISINQKMFDKIGLRSLVDFDILIEKNHCSIYDEKNILQTTIVRQKGTWHNGCRWGGRKYFIIGATNSFYEGLDWVN